MEEKREEKTCGVLEVVWIGDSVQHVHSDGLRPVAIYLHTINQIKRSFFSAFKKINLFYSNPFEPNPED